MTVCNAMLLPGKMHVLHVIFILTYTRISPIGGHDGYDKPLGGSLVHYLHHTKFTVNYGTPCTHTHTHTLVPTRDAVVLLSCCCRDAVVLLSCRRAISATSSWLARPRSLGRYLLLH